jgi:ABC-type nitrate/sulfonate/bicarbonate transport system substrate-binding protein
VLPNPRIYTQHFNLVTTEGLMVKRHGDMARLLRALARAEDVVKRKPALARDVLAQRLGVDTDVATQALKEHDYRLRLDQSLVSTMSSQMRWAVRQQHVKPGTLPDSALALIQPSLLREAAPAAVSIVR